MNQTPQPSISFDEIRQHLLEAIEQELKLDPESVRADRPVMSYGIDSMQFIGLIGELEQWLGCRILSNPLARYPTVDDLAAWIARERAAGRTQLDPNHHFSQTEASQLVQGYYEELNEGSIQAGLFLGHRAAVRDDTQQRHFMDFTRSRRDILQLELIPNFKAVYNGATITINRWGMRNRDIEKTKQPGTLRIALLGSSVVMGYGVGDEQTFAVHLESLLNTDKHFTDSNLRYEVLNFGAGKYTAIQRRALLENKVLDFDPDVVLYIAHQDELASPVFDMAKLADNNLIDDPCLLDILAGAQVDATTPAGVIRNRMQDHALEILSCTYDRIIAFCREHSIAPVWVELPMPGHFEIPGTPTLAHGLALQAGFDSLDLTHWADGYEPAEVKLHADAHHASAKGHTVIAEKLLDELRTHPNMLRQRIK